MRFDEGEGERERDQAMGDERREHKRLPVKLWVDEIHESNTYFQRAANLSVGGMFLEGTIPHVPGTVVHLRFTLPDDPEPLELRAEVVGDPSDLGMNVKFLDVEFNGEIKRRLEAFINRAGTRRGF